MYMHCGSNAILGLHPLFAAAWLQKGVWSHPVNVTLLYANHSSSMSMKRVMVGGVNRTPKFGACVRTGLEADVRHFCSCYKGPIWLTTALLLVLRRSNLINYCSWATEFTKHCTCWGASSINKNNLCTNWADWLSRNEVRPWPDQVLRPCAVKCKPAAASKQVYQPLWCANM